MPFSSRAGEAGARPTPPGPILVDLTDEAATRALARTLAAILEPGDTVALSGAIGAGKTTLARAFLRERLGDPDLEVPSPTFTLVQTYEASGGSVVHADLYRIGGGDELVELGFDEVTAGAVTLVEWPERALDALSPDRLDILLAIAPEGGRRAVISGAGESMVRFARAQAVVDLATRAGWGDARRIPMGGDASTRAYERLERADGRTAILMISPPRPDGPPVRRGKPYSAIARLAESVHAFVAMDGGLRDQGFSAPAILAEDLDRGLLLIEDLGPEIATDARGPIPERYAETVRLLADLHARDLPTTLPLGQDVYDIPPYDQDALLIEVDLLLEWYLPFVEGTRPSGSVQAEFGHVWREAIGPVLAGPQTWVLRDVHSPNLIWLPERRGIARVGLIDFQDAVIGSPAYDVVSLLQDARVTVSPELEMQLLGVYATERKARDPGFDFDAFAAAYAILGAQRATKILGIFARLDRRDGKPHYLAHLPRIRAYLARCLAHPALARLAAWFDRNAPGALPGPEPEPPGPMAVMVLAAGLGSRMRPITDRLPKPLVPVGGKPLLDHALDRVAAAGLGRVVVNVHHLADQIETHVGRRQDLDLTVSDERDALLETGGGVRRALPLLGSEFVVMNSDSLWTEPGAANLPRLVAAWDPEAADILLLLAPRDSLGYDGAGDFLRDESGLLARRPAGGTAPWVYAGVAVMKASLFVDTPDGAFSLNRLFDAAIATGRLHGLPLEGEWLHVGTPDAIEAAEARLAAASGR